METTELLVIEESRHTKISKCRLSVVVICILGAVGLIVGLTKVTLNGKSKLSYNYFMKSSSECFVPQYDNTGKLMNESVPCSEAMYNAFSSQYLPNDDIYSPILNGMNIFKPFPNSCFKSQGLRITRTKVDNYINTQSFYRKVTSDTNVALSIAGRFTMGVTLNVKTDSMTAGRKEVMGSSIEILTHTRSIFLDENCYKGPSSLLTDNILKVFDDLPETISKPWLSRSWWQYELFFKRFGTHFRTEVLMGSSLRQWTFATFSESLTMRALQVKACFDLLGKASSKITITLKACSGFTEEDFAKYSKIATSYNLEIRGGTDATRNALRGKQTAQLIEKLLNEGRKMESPVTYKYQSIWDIFSIKYINDSRRLRIAENMKHYYMGYRDYGCTHVKIHGLSARKFHYVNDDMTRPSFECVLASKGCHSNGDCHGDSTSFADKDAYCYGDTCLKYKNPPFGTKAISVSSRSKKTKDDVEGLNKGCIYSDGDAKCFNGNEKTVIWDNDGSKHIVIPTSAPPFNPTATKFNFLYLLLLLIPGIGVFILIIYCCGCRLGCRNPYGSISK